MIPKQHPIVYRIDSNLSLSSATICTVQNVHIITKISNSFYTRNNHAKRTDNTDKNGDVYGKSYLFRKVILETELSSRCILHKGKGNC